MNRWILSLAAAAALGFTLAGTSLAQDTDAQGASGAPAILNEQQDEGNQGFSRYRGDADGGYRGDADGGYGCGWNRDQGGWGWDRGRFQTNLEGRWVADNRETDFDRGGFGGFRGFRGQGGMRDVLLPALIQIDQRPNMVRISNRRNRPLQLIMLGGKFDSRYGGDHPDYLLGRWRGATLAVQHDGPGRSAITQTFSLENRGRTLVVRTRRENGGWGSRTMEFTTTYRRA